MKDKRDPLAISKDPRICSHVRICKSDDTLYYVRCEKRVSKSGRTGFLCFEHSLALDQAYLFYKKPAKSEAQLESEFVNGIILTDARKIASTPSVRVNARFPYPRIES